MERCCPLPPTRLLQEFTFNLLRHITTRMSVPAHAPTFNMPVWPPHHRDHTTRDTKDFLPPSLFFVNIILSHPTVKGQPSPRCTTQEVPSNEVAQERLVIIDVVRLYLEASVILPPHFVDSHRHRPKSWNLNFPVSFNAIFPITNPTMKFTYGIDIPVDPSIVCYDAIGFMSFCD